MSIPDSTVEDFSDSEHNIKCELCGLKTYSLVDTSSCVHLIKNQLWLSCRDCGKFFHLHCIKDYYYNLDDLIELIEQFYYCTNCRSQ